MKVLMITRGGLELARAHLHRPYATIGRSPSCDVVLRASGIAPVHFLLEWVGVGEFNPSEGQWSIFEIANSSEEAGEGVIIGQEDVLFCGLHFKWLEDKLENEQDIGGHIQSSLSTAAQGHESVKLSGASLLEVVQVRTDSGAIENVVHLSPVRNRGLIRPLRKMPSFRLLGASSDGRRALQLLLEEMKGALVYRRGAVLGAEDLKNGHCTIKEGDVLEVRWQRHLFFLRIVPEIRVPKVRRNWSREPLLTKLSLAGAVLALVFTLLFASGRSLSDKKEKEASEPPRVAKVEIKELAPPPPPPPPPAPLPVAPVAKEKPEPVREVKKEAPVAGLKLQAPAAKPGAAAAPSFDKKTPKKEIGLNSPAQKRDVNLIGVLGALSKKNAGPKGQGIRADRIFNDGVITESASGAEGRITVGNPAPGTIGVGKGGSPKADGSALAGAATTLSGTGGFDPKSAGPIGRSGGKSGFSVGSGLGGSGKDLGKGSSVGSLDTTQMQVSGGLDRETVRRIIAKYRGQIRACYERALLSSPDVAGRVVYTWTISPQGPVVSAQLTRSQLNSHVLEGCVLNVIKTMAFPVAPNGRSTIVIYPFVFQAQAQ